MLSRKALAPFAELTKSSKCDNVLLEHALALELKERALVQAIMPLPRTMLKTSCSWG